METQLLAAYKCAGGERFIVAIVQTTDIVQLFTELESKQFFHIHVTAYKKIQGCIMLPMKNVDEESIVVKDNLYQIMFEGKIQSWDEDAILSRISTFIFDE